MAFEYQTNALKLIQIILMEANLVLLPTNGMNACGGSYHTRFNVTLTHTEPFCMSRGFFFSHKRLRRCAKIKNHMSVCNI